MKIKAITSSAGNEKIKVAIDKFLEAQLDPAFGALPKQESELLILELLIDLGAVSKRPTVYELVSNLKVTRSKARRLIYDRELRTSSENQLESDVRQLLVRPIIQKKGDSFALEIENPFLADFVREKLRKLGHVTDGSFSPSVVTLSLKAMTSLIESYLSDSQKKIAKDALISAGAPGSGIKSLLEKALKKLGEKVADETGELAAEEIIGHLKSILEGSKTVIAEKFKPLFAQN